MNRASFLTRIALGTPATLGWKRKERKPYTATDVLKDREVGKTYFVDYKRGKDTNDGLSFEKPITWDAAMSRINWGSSPDLIYVLKPK